MINYIKPTSIPGQKVAGRSQPRFPAIAIIAYIPLGPNPKPMNVYRNCSFSGRSTCINQPTAIAVGLTMVLGCLMNQSRISNGANGATAPGPPQKGAPHNFILFLLIIIVIKVQ